MFIKLLLKLADRGKIGLPLVQHLRLAKETVKWLKSLPPCL